MKLARLQVISMDNRAIKVMIITRSNIRHQTFISKFSLTFSDKKISFKFKRKKVPLAVCFVMTINESQGQSFSKIGLFIREPIFHTWPIICRFIEN